MQDLRPWIGDPPLKEPPQVPGYQLVGVEKPGLMKLSLLGVPMLLVWLFLFPVLVGLVSRHGEVTLSINSGADIFRILSQFLIVLIVTFSVHEGIHGLAIALQGKKPSFGAGPGYFYTTVLKPLSRNGYLVVALAPAIIISVGCFVLALQSPTNMGWWVAISTINVSGLGGDLWMAKRMIQTPTSAQIVDMADGFAVYSPINSSHDLSQ